MENGLNLEFIMVFLISSSIPILYAYIVQAQDTRYFYFLYPIFCLISLFAVETIISKFNKKNMIIFLIILSIITSSVVDYEKERELKEIAEIISNKITGTNFHPTVTKYVKIQEIPSEWPFLFHEMYKIESVSSSNYDNIEKYILDNENKLSHLIVNENNKLPKFLIDVFQNGKKYNYLEKEFDSKDYNFIEHIKLFKINYEKFNSNLKE